MPSDKDEKDPSSTSVEYDAMTLSWSKMDSLMGGTEAMRDAEQKFLPMHIDESQKVYEERLRSSTLFNMTKITINDLVGLPFGEPIQVNEDVPPQIAEWLEDIDLQGNNIDVFARNWFKSGLTKAFSHVYVDFPEVQKDNKDGTKRTLLQDRTENIRPYWVSIPPENLIYARAEVIAGKEVLQEIRIMEVVSGQVGFIQTFSLRVRRILPGIVELWVPTDQKRNNKTVWRKERDFAYGLDFIPLVTFYSDRENFMKGIPPLIDLADLNIQHWQSTSDQISALTVARFPILALSGGAPENDKLIVGPRRWLHTPDAKAKYYYVENTGAAIAAGRIDLQDLESRMSAFGSQFLKKRPGSITATERALDSAEATSPLQDAVRRFNDSVNLALDFTAQWAKFKEGGSVTIASDFSVEEGSDENLRTLTSARERIEISRKAYMEELKLRNIVSEDYDIDGDLVQIQKEQMEVDDGSSEEELDPLKGNDKKDDDDDIGTVNDKDKDKNKKEVIEVTT